MIDKEAVTTKPKQVEDADGRIPYNGWQSLGIGFLAFFAPQFLVIIPLLVLMLTGGYSTLEDTLNGYDDWIVNGIGALTFAGFGTALIWLFLRNHGGFKTLGFKRTRIDDMITVLPVFFAYFLSLTGIFALIAILIPAIDLDQTQDIGFENDNSAAEYVVAFITLVIIAPLFEELLFRGFVFRGVAQQYGFWIGALLTSGLFAVAHLQLNVGIDTFVLGMFASWLVWHTKSVWPAVALHVIKNLVAYIYIFVLNV
jgi:membrane protease YdiL (CAAX protease family)